jgi:hypothetical protein
MYLMISIACKCGIEFDVPIFANANDGSRGLSTAFCSGCGKRMFVPGALAGPLVRLK